MKYVGPIRKELGIRTVFNILGPLTNPAKPTLFLLGVCYLVEPLAKVLSSLGVRRGALIFGQDGMDEASISAPTAVWNRDGFYRTTTDALEVGCPAAPKTTSWAASPAENA